MNSNWIIFLAFALLIFFLPEQSSAFDQSEKYTAKQVRKELRHTQNLLRKLQPNLNAHRSVKKVKKLFKEIEAEIEPQMNIGGVATLVQKTLAVACDEHTHIDLSGQYKSMGYRRNLFFKPLAITANKTYLTRDMYARESTEVLGVGNSKNVVIGKKIAQFYRSLTSADGCLQNKPLITSFQSYDNLLFLSNLIGKNTNFHLYKYGKISGGNHDKYVAGKSAGDIGGEHWRTRKKLPIKPLTNLGMKSFRSEFWKVNAKSHPGIIGFHSTDSRYSYVYVREFKSGKDASKALDKIMREVIKRNPEHVIVDLTTSPGGYIDQASRLLSYFLSRSHQVASRMYKKTRRVSVDKSFKAISKKRLAAKRKFTRQFRRAKRRRGRYTLKVRRRSFGHPHYKGKVTVLVSPLTHSAATMTALILKKDRKATVVGYQNAGSVSTSCFAPGGTYQLPISKLNVRIADTCYLRAGASRKKGGPLVPDIEVDPMTSTPKNLIAAIQKAGVEHVLKSGKKTN